MGNLTRIILELGFDRDIVLARAFPNKRTRVRAVNTIWTIFVVERQLTYALGLSDAIQCLRLEPSFPEPVRRSEGQPWPCPHNSHKHKVIC